MLTEDEAKTKWCPKYQVATSGGDSSTFESDNRPPEWHEDPTEADPKKRWKATGGFQPSARCIASGCMVWRWVRGSSEVGGFKRVDPEDLRRIGYCGLAGLP